jgi:hypothetical protein
MLFRNGLAGLNYLFVDEMKILKLCFLYALDFVISLKLQEVGVKHGQII